MPTRYGDAFADVYDDWYGTAFDTDGAVALLGTLAARGPVLELGVGTGRLALPLAALDLALVGLDASARMLEQLAAKPGSDAISTVLADMAEVGAAVRAAGGSVPPDGYALVFSAYNTFLNLDTEAAQRRCLAGVSSLLAADGVLVVEAYVPAPPEDVPRTSIDVARVTSDAVVLTCTEHDPANQHVTGQHVELRDGSVRLRPWSVRYLTPEQLDALAADAGLVLEERWQDWRATPFDDDSASHVSVYRRRSDDDPVPEPLTASGTALGFERGARSDGPSPSPPASVSQLRLNPLNGRWVAIATERASRPGEFAPGLVRHQPEAQCPFCPGHEGETPPALETYGPRGEWLVRVVPNLYPAFEGKGAFEVEDLGPVFHQAPGTGIHEVLVFSPDHRASWADLDDRQVGLVIAAIRDRMEVHAEQLSVRYTQAIVNHGREAGASLEHPHGQLLGIPFVPEELQAEMDGFADRDEPCVMCTTLEEEERAGHRLLLADERVVVVCPFWSATPYEMLIVPRHHEGHLALAAPGDLVGVSRALRDALAALERLVGDTAYNVVFHTAPHGSTDRFHWHIHVLPRLTSAAGFEAGTGVRINIVAPEQAAVDLRTA